MKKADIILIIVIVAVAGLVFLLLGNNESGRYVTIEQNGVITETLKLDSDTEREYKSELGTNRVVIKDGRVRVTEADCPDKICVKHREIYRDGESIICLPHKLVITVSNDNSSGADAVV